MHTFERASDAHIRASIQREHMQRILGTQRSRPLCDRRGAAKGMKYLTVHDRMPGRTHKTEQV
eukprot:3059138-Pleurochrysis_carterae.AAC.1